MSTIAIGDVHGNLAALDDLLNRITMEISADDTVVFLGDYIDRGPDASGCIQRIIDFRRAGKGRVVTLLGNHEEWLLRTHEDYTRHSWLRHGRFSDRRELFSIRSVEAARRGRE